MTAFQRGAVGRVVCQFCLKIAQKPLKTLPGLHPGPAESTHLWTSTPSVWTPRRGPEHNQVIRICGNRGARITCKKPSPFLAASGHSGQRADDLWRCGNDGSIIHWHRHACASHPLALGPSAYSPARAPFSQESGVRLDLQARSSTMRRWSVAEETGLP